MNLEYFFSTQAMDDIPFFRGQTTDKLNAYLAQAS